MVKDIAIIIPCYKRTSTLRGLLNSLLNAQYDRNVDLVFSIDYSGNDDVSVYADNFEWPFGKKTIIKHSENIGLRRNIISCGDMTEFYDAVIVLEDDLVVSPWFFMYASKACEFYSDDDRVAGISLYNYRFTESKHEFFPINGGYDTYFIQWTSSWGQLWTKKQWKGFKVWYDEHNLSLEEYHIPKYVKMWKESWKKYNIAYIVDTGKYYVYPHESYATMVPTSGTHVAGNNLRNPFLVPLCTGIQRDFVFQKLDGAVKYDSFFELCTRPIMVEGKELMVTFNIYCEKLQDDIDGDYYISSKIQNQQPVKTWSRCLLPYEKNVIDSLLGNELFLYCKSDFQEERLTVEEKRMMNVDLSGKELLQIGLNRILRKLRLLPNKK